jgi:hypothetical protein
VHDVLLAQSILVRRDWRDLAHGEIELESGAYRLLVLFPRQLEPRIAASLPH